MTGTIDCFFVSPSLIMQYLKSGKLRALSVSSAQRIACGPTGLTRNEFGRSRSGCSDLGADKAAGRGRGLSRSLSRHARKNVEAYARRNRTRSSALRRPSKAYVVSEIERYRHELPPLGIQMD